MTELTNKDPSRYFEAYVVRDVSSFRQLMLGRDRNGKSNMIAIYTEEQRIPKLKINATIRVRNPLIFLKYFADGVHKGLRVEDEDLKNIEIIPMRLQP